MFKNHLRVAFRNILRQKVYNLLNAAGLATGIACGLVIALHIREELSYEKDFKDHEKIHRVHEDGWAKISPPMALEMSASLPQIQAITRFSAHGTHVVNTDENNPGEARGYFADSTVFDVFSYRIVDGDRKQALRGANTVVITESMARRYFGDQGAVGKTLKFDNQLELAVIAILQACGPCLYRGRTVNMVCYASVAAEFCLPHGDPMVGVCPYRGDHLCHYPWGDQFSHCGRRREKPGESVEV